ncbi:hypothetical protein C4J98_4260 [Pseudomonas orientalis]|nr:hypothetical protein C4J98_4260 [Pseudomonas orientalis]
MPDEFVFLIEFTLPIELKALARLASRPSDARLGELTD